MDEDPVLLADDRRRHLLSLTPLGRSVLAEFARQADYTKYVVHQVTRGKNPRAILRNPNTGAWMEMSKLPPGYEVQEGRVVKSQQVVKPAAPVATSRESLRVADTKQGEYRQLTYYPHEAQNLPHEAQLFPVAARTIETARRTRGAATIADVYDALKAKDPSLALTDFHKQLLAWQQADKVQLQVINDPEVHSKEEIEKGLVLRLPRGVSEVNQLMRGSSPRFYVQLTDKGAATLLPAVQKTSSSGQTAPIGQSLPGQIKDQTQATLPGTPLMTNHPLEGMSREQMLATLVPLYNAGTDAWKLAQGIEQWQPTSAPYAPLAKEVIRAVQEAQKKNSFDRPAIEKLYAQMQEKYPKLTLLDFQKSLVKMMANGQIRLDPHTQAKVNAPTEKLRALIPLDMELKGYVDLPITRRGVLP